MIRLYDSKLRTKDWIKEEERERERWEKVHTPATDSLSVALCGSFAILSIYNIYLYSISCASNKQTNKPTQPRVLNSALLDYVQSTRGDHPKALPRPANPTLAGMR